MYLCICCIVSKELCVEIAKVRNKLQRIPFRNIIFLDETYLRISDSPRQTLLMPSETECVIVEENSSYAARYDMITFVSGEEVFPAKIYSPQDRAQLGVSGITTDMLHAFIEDFLGRAIAATDRYPLYLLCDKSTIHKIDQLKESFENGFCFEIVDISLLPTKSAKRLSPLDNGLYHDWKERCRKHYPISYSNIKQIMNDEWEKTTKEQLRSYYKHCLFSRGSNVYQDCPLPNVHLH